MECRLIGVPLQIGAGRLGCEMGPSALRIAGLGPMLEELGHRVTDLGNVAPAAFKTLTHPNSAVHHLPETVAWIETLSEAAYRESADAMPIFLGGDHALSAGTVPGLARRAAEQGRPLFVLWLDAHTDFHTLETTESGNLHGTPVAYFTGQPGFAGYFPDLVEAVDPAHVAMIGIRSVDPAERAALRRTGITVHDMRMIDEHGVAVLLRAFLDKVRAANGLLHVSFDVDFLDPMIAPAVGTTVPGGATFREAHLVMEMLHDSGLVSSLDLVELNPFLDERGRTAILMADLTASLMGRQVMDRPTRDYAGSV
ncbi:arginase [Agrobacterium vitis]|uniref:arginase n=1 Tax=Rhizobium/Agrobacterium group TaxID=227290 RepID=UPI0012E7EA5D|nr:MULTISPECIES: arginase [Rhizobium/Agrobacterium group]MCF1449663.1 arginase [Allorhizobium ampelinum]MCF1464534.1 arginase [Allorhizobium ampelinum]MCF1495170.1 arginase [Allorhizobium ampelinum]MVA48084.1 arginase [Agrobacterium vitis]